MDASSLSIDLSPTMQLHQGLAARADAKADQYLSALSQANQTMSDQGIRLGQLKPLEVPLSALLLSRRDVDRLRHLALTMHGIVEKALALLTDDLGALSRSFPHHRRIMPFLQKTAGSPHWQVVSRYDIAVAPDGTLKFMELNTGCPGGLMISEAIAIVTRLAFDKAGENAHGFEQNGGVTRLNYVDGLLAVEQRSGIEPAMVALLNDENELSFELDLLADGLFARDRDVQIVDARTLEEIDGRLYANGNLVSLTCNKFRISTPNSPNHCWRSGFEQRYAAFLSAQKEQQVVSINNLAGMTIAEDKSLLGVLQSPWMRDVLTEDERRFIADHVLWTQPLDAGTAAWRGHEQDVLTLARENHEHFVIKPANEGRGFAVVVGKWTNDDEWKTACKIDPNMPKILQEYAESVQFPVVRGQTGGELQQSLMYLTLGLVIVDGQYQGIISRISSNPVTNVAQDGYGQAVFCH